MERLFFVSWKAANINNSLTTAAEEADGSVPNLNLVYCPVNVFQNVISILAIKTKEKGATVNYRQSCHSTFSSMHSGPALSRCGCIGPNAMVVGQVVYFCQIHLEPENCVKV